MEPTTTTEEYTVDQHTCNLGIPQGVCVACCINKEYAEEQRKILKENARLLLAQPHEFAAVSEEIGKARRQRAADKDGTLYKAFLQMKRQEEKMMLEQLERQKKEPPKKLDWKVIDELRKKYPHTNDFKCPATEDKEHKWGPIEVVGQSWHGPVLSKTCTSCAHNWSNH